MMRMTVLASGSKGNSTVISSSRTCVLVDAGLSCRELLKRMSIAGQDPAQLDAILITHEHQDHIAGLSVLARRLNIPVFFTEPTHRAWVRMLTPRTTMTYAKWLDHVQREKEARAAAVAVQAGRKSVRCIMVTHHGQTDLLQVIRTLRSCGRFPNFLYGGQKHPDQNGDDGNHDQ